MQITKIKVNGFKSLVDFEVDLSKFNCLIGLNSSGKSTVLQFIDFAARLVRGDMEGWFKERQWEKSDVGSKLFRQKQTIDFTIEIQASQSQVFEWVARYNMVEKKCTSEIFRLRELCNNDVNEEILLRTKSQQVRIYKRNMGEKSNRYFLNSKIAFRYSGSILSQITEEMLHEELKTLSVFFRNINSFDMLAPRSLRKRARN